MSLPGESGPETPPSSSDALLEQLRASLAPRYAVERRIGEGPLGFVFLAREDTGRAVAIKALRPELVNAVGAAYALHEMGVAAKLSHPHILPILASGEALGVVYYVCPFVEGESLRQRLDREGPLPYDEALRIAREVADATSYAHRHRVLHRDINPSNVLLEDGRTIVKDFWIARALAVALPWGATPAGLRLGSPAHMSVEQSMAAHVDTRSDVYSLACLVVEMLVGHPPFVDARERSTTFGLPPRVMAELARVRPAVIPSITRALSASADDRFASPADFLAALDAPLAQAIMARHLPEESDAGMFGAPLSASPSTNESGALRARAPTPGPGEFTQGLGAPGRAAAPGQPRRYSWGARTARPPTFGWVSALVAWVRAKVAGLLRPRPIPASLRVSVERRRDDQIKLLNSALRYRYTVKHQLGRGGMANVYVADDLRYQNRQVALKVLRPELVASVASERFLLEIEITARLTHPLILPLLDSGDADGLLFYAMPFLDGTTLRDTLERQHWLPITDAVRVASDVAAALDYAHRKGIVHRDVKPENILLYEGQAMVADFGIALALDRAGTRLSREGSPGTPMYMSPEQLWDADRIDYRSDIYSLGCVVYEMLTGRPPYTGTFQKVAANHLSAPIPHAGSLRPEVSGSMDRAICKALEKSPDDRFQSALAFATALGQAQGDGRLRLPVAPTRVNARTGDGPSASA